jgi:peptidoglycan/LPS O-acetylase OafA/YrhL
VQWNALLCGNDQMFERFLNTGRFGSLDGLRALSILGVLWVHSHLVFSSEWPILDRGQMGVFLFFAISGFLITSLMIRERTRTGTILMRNFYARRSLRIFPLYYAVLCTYIVLVAILEKNPDGEDFFRNLPYFLTYTSNWFVGLGDDERVIFVFAWSLATEEQFYLTWPWLERYVSPMVRYLALAGLILLSAATQFGLLLWMIPADSLGYAVLWSIAPPILFGVGAAHLLHAPRGFHSLAAVLGRRWSAPVAAAAVIALLCVPPGEPPWEWLIYLALTLLVVACVIREDHGLAFILRQRFLVRIGMVSYGIYLMHMLCFAAMKAAGLAIGIESPVVHWVSGVILVYLVAELSFATFERFFARMKPAAEPGAGAAEQDVKLPRSADGTGQAAS